MNPEHPESSPKTPALMVLGTSSHAGKTAVAAGLCRLLARRGIRVAPFKAQNMSNNSHVTPEGGEIGRAQALQARAAGVDSHTDMNPVLLKPSGGGECQVVLHGRPWAVRGAREYYDDKAFLGAEARRAYDRLASRFEAVVLEGAGSPAEINLADGDFVNLAMAEHAGARCLLVADIDRGGVFASILGTLRLLQPRHRGLVAGVLINKFRGDPSLLDPGIRAIERLTGVPVLGVLPWLEDLGLEEEDSLGLPAPGGDPEAARGTAPDASAPARLDVAVLGLPHIANFTDFAPLAGPPFHLRYVTDPFRLGNPDLLILPGSKAVRRDLAWLESAGLARAVRAAAARHVPVLGICGGYQMLGAWVRDPLGVEGDPGESAGLGLLPAETRMERGKELSRVSGRNLALPFLPAGTPVSGYEIHMGRTRIPDGASPALEIAVRNGSPVSILSGSAAADRPVWGCYLHGLFDNPRAVAGLSAWLHARRGLDVPAANPPAHDAAPAETPGAADGRTDPLDRLADALDAFRILAALLPGSPGP